MGIVGRDGPPPAPTKAQGTDAVRDLPANSTRRAGLTVCPFTSTEVEAALLRVSVTADEENGLDQDSFLVVDKMTTVRRSNARTVVGRLEATTLIEFERRLLVFLGFGT